MKSTFILVTGIVLSALTSARSLHSRQSGNSQYNCMPGQACWPTTAQFNAFNQSIDGRLKAAVPWAKPCFSGLSFGTAYDPVACNYIESHYADNPVIGQETEPVGPYREPQYGSFSQLNWESCGAQDCMFRLVISYVSRYID